MAGGRLEEMGEGQGQGRAGRPDSRTAACWVQHCYSTLSGLTSKHRSSPRLCGRVEASARTLGSPGLWPVCRTQDPAQLGVLAGLRADGRPLSAGLSQSKAAWASAEGLSCVTRSLAPQRQGLRQRQREHRSERTGGQGLASENRISEVALDPFAVFCAVTAAGHAQGKDVSTGQQGAWGLSRGQREGPEGVVPAWNPQLVRVQSWGWTQFCVLEAWTLAVPRRPQGLWQRLWCCHCHKHRDSLGAGPACGYLDRHLASSCARKSLAGVWGDHCGAPLSTPQPGCPSDVPLLCPDFPGLLLPETPQWGFFRTLQM